jgi:hypothetical protein
MQAGNAAFTTSANNKTLALGFKRPVAGIVHPNQTPSGTKTHIVAAYLPYVSASQFTQVASRNLIVSRKTGSISALRFSYNIIGY